MSIKPVNATTDEELIELVNKANERAKKLSNEKFKSRTALTTHYDPTVVEAQLRQQGINPRAVQKAKVDASKIKLRQDALERHESKKNAATENAAQSKADQGSKKSVDDMYRELGDLLSDNKKTKKKSDTVSTANSGIFRKNNQPKDKKSGLDKTTAGFSVVKK